MRCDLRANGSSVVRGRVHSISRVLGCREGLASPPTPLQRIAVQRPAAQLCCARSPCACHAVVDVVLPPTYFKVCGFSRRVAAVSVSRSPNRHREVLWGVKQCSLCNIVMFRRTSTGRTIYSRQPVYSDSDSAGLSCLTSSASSARRKESSRSASEAASFVLACAMRAARRASS